MSFCIVENSGMFNEYLAESGYTSESEAIDAMHNMYDESEQEALTVRVAAFIGGVPHYEY